VTAIAAAAGVPERAAANARVYRQRATEIVGSGFALPSDRVDNDAFFARAKFPLGNDSERAELIQGTRMKTRTWCGPGEHTWTLARDAVKMALASSEVPAEEIDLVIVSSCSTMPVVNYPNPANPVMADLAPLVLAQLGRDDGVGIDLKAAYCAGFLRGLEMMDAMLENPGYRAGLLVAADEGGRFATAESNKSAFCFLVGDAAGAVILRKTDVAPRVGLVDYLGHTVPSKAELTGWGADGRSLFVKGSKASAAGLALMLDAGRTLLARNGLGAEDVDWLLPAQTHVATVEALSDGLGLPREKLLWAGDETGYSASASIAAALGARKAEGTIRKGDLVLSVAVGAGMNVAGALYHA
jgi:3-oxoacyl-[acyl-carrier-protein] synthase-3